MSGRIDPHSYRPQFRELLLRLRDRGAKRLADIVAFSDETWDQKDGRFGEEFPYIEISAVGLGNNEYEVAQVRLADAASRARLVVRGDDIVVSLTRPNRGAIAAIRSEDDGAIASTGFAVLRELLGDECSKQYLLLALSSRFSLDQMSMRASGGNYPAITGEELGNVLLPCSNREQQDRLITTMEVARSTRRAKIAEAYTLLAGLDGYLLNALSLFLPPVDNRKVFAARPKDAQGQGHLNADFFHPERVIAVRAIENADNIDHFRLDEVVSFIRDQVKTPDAVYLSLAHVQSNTGELIEVDEKATGACSTFKTNDVLFARLRPYLNKVYCAEMDGSCSPEFHVLRVRDAEVLLPDYLAAILRSSLILAQTRHMMTGNTHPRLTNEDVVGLVIPVPSLIVQKRISAEARRRREEARRLRMEAEVGWQTAKRSFEEQLLGASR